MQLRPYQLEGVQSLRHGFSLKLRRQILHMATGSGKTKTALFMVMGAVAKGRRVIFICNRKALVNQASAVFHEAGVEHGIVQAENTRDLHHQVIIASIQSLKTRGIPSDIGLIIFDEAHFTSGSAIALEIMIKHSLVPVIGLSATPYSKGLGRHIPELNGPMYQNVVQPITIKELIKQGHLVDVDIYGPSEPDMGGYKLRNSAYGMDYSDEDSARANDTPELVGNIVENYIKHVYGEPTVVFASLVSHSKHIVNEFQTAGIPAAHIDAHTTDEERKEIFAQFEDGRIWVISNVGVCGEGWDSPKCKVMILARTTRSLIRMIQFCGRVLRPIEGKDRAIIYDHSGTIANLGFPTDDFDIELDTTDPKKSEGAKEKDKKESLPKVCPECKFMKPAGIHKCPKCGLIPQATRDIETIDGELVLLKGKSKLTMIDKQQEYSELLGYAREKGWNEGWAYHQFRTKHGHYPANTLKKVAVPISEKMYSWVVSQNIRRAKANAKFTGKTREAA